MIACLAPWKPCYCMRAGGSFSLFIATSSSIFKNLELVWFAKVMSSSTLTTDQATIASYYRNAYKSHVGPQITDQTRRANFAQLAPTDLHTAKIWLPSTSSILAMNNEKLAAAPLKHAGGDAKQAIKFAWPYISQEDYTLTVIIVRSFHHGSLGMRQVARTFSRRWLAKTRAIVNEIAIRRGNRSTFQSKNSDMYIQSHDSFSHTPIPFHGSLEYTSLDPVRTMSLTTMSGLGNHGEYS